MTYVPHSMPQPTAAQASAFARDVGFGSVILGRSPDYAVAHVPIQVILDSASGEAEELVFHFSTKNALSDLLVEPAQVLIIFRGPDGYISPRWYDHENVPTWDYAVVQMTGRATPVDEGRLRQHVKDLVRQFEPEVAIREAYIDQYLDWIRGFSLRSPAIEPVFKLSQDKNEASIAGVLHGLRQRAKGLDEQLAAAIEAARR
ncbi:FMN-binding negative transcriptional regulator [Actinomadura sp. 3N508]|uniref:FMN-binding negative transcriptional regulator n=1 Tax=Actinomadura sp. 3N508 TaxID=3375153 RepID=UPI0037AC7FA1